MREKYVALTALSLLYRVQNGLCADMVYFYATFLVQCPIKVTRRKLLQMQRH
jgi:hypothetical protein